MSGINSKTTNSNILVPKHNVFDLVGIENYAMFGELSILMTSAEQYMHRFGLIENLSKQGFFIKTKNNAAKIILGKEFEPSLYRGQNDGNKTLTPSFQREHLVNNDVNHCVEFIKREEFKFVFQETPYYKILSKMQILGNNFEFDLDALAQHYEFATNYLDVTKDIRVALFFAYTDCVNGNYFPIEDFDKYKPTLFVANFTSLTLNEDKLVAVGFQAASRPQVQSAMAINITESPSEHNLYFRKVELTPSKDIAHGIFNSFNGGKSLFPEEPIKIIKNKIREKMSLNKYLFSKYCRLYNKDKEKLKNELLKKYVIDESNIKIDEELYRKMEDETTEVLIPWILENISYRKVKLAQREDEHFYIDIYANSLK